MEFPVIRREPESANKALVDGPVTNGQIEDRIAHTQEKELAGGANWVVQKYGGTSVGKFPLKIVEEIVMAGLQPPNNQRIAVVCSARSTGSKAEGTTNRLLRAARDAEAGSWNFASIVQSLREDHLDALTASLPGARLMPASPELDAITTHYAAQVNAVCDHLLKVLESALFLKDVTSQTMDMVMSVGEKLSCLYMTALLQSRSVHAVYVDLSDAIPVSAAPAPKSLNEAFYATLAATFGTLIRALTADPAAVPVITGYFGKLPGSGGLLDHIGRGYTDLCAALIAVGMGARELQIWKEVDGIFTADPRKVPTARLLPSVTPSEAAELTFYGSEVIHPFTMDQVIRAGIPVRIKNVMNPRSAGTVILPDVVEEGQSRRKGLIRNRSTSLLANSMAGRGRGPKRPTAVTIKPNITVLNIHSHNRTRAHGFLMSIFSTLDRHGLSVDLLASSEVHVSMALHCEPPPSTPTNPAQRTPADDAQTENLALQSTVDDLLATWSCDIDLVPNMAIISLVGRDLRSMVGISGRFFGVLGRTGVNVEMISQGASEISIGCVIEAREAVRALNVVHTELFTFLE